MQVAAETLVKTQKLIDSNRGEQEGNREARRIDREKENAARNGLRVCGQHEDSGKHGADARRPPKGKCESEKKAAGHSGKRAAGLGFFRGLAAEIVEAHIAIEPARERRSGEENQCD